MEDDLSVSSDDLVFIRINVPELSVEKCLQFGRHELVWEIKQQCLSSLPKELKESFNYGLFYPPQNGKAGKFLDEARPVADYPFPEPVGYLELKYKRRVYKMLKLDERQLRAAHSRSNLRRLLEHVTGGHADKVAKLLAKGLDPNFHCAETGETPLTLTAKLPSPKRMILTLVNGGAIVDYRTLEGATALHKAVERNNFEALKTLLDLGASPNYQDAKGLTPLYHSIVYNADPLLCQALLHDHATTGAQDAQGWTEVHQAARRSMTQHLEHLLFYGADMNARNASGNTPLHVCAINGQEACARVLLFRGADREALNFANQTPHQVAVIAANMELADLILSHRPEDVVPFKEAPKYNPRRRSGIVLPRTHSESRLSSPLSKPPSPSPSNRSLPPFSSASSLSETSSGSGGTCTQALDQLPATAGDQLDAVSESSGIGTSNGSGSGDSCDHHPEMALVLAAGAAATTVVCVEAYSTNLPGHVNLTPGDVIEVSASTDHGLLEGCVAGHVGLFPARCVREVRLRKPPCTSSDAAPPPAPACEPPFAGDRYPFPVPLSAAAVGGHYAAPSHYGTAPRQRGGATVAAGGRCGPLPRTVLLRRGARGFGFVLRGAKAASPLMELRPSDRCPALQYLDDVDPGGVAELAGLAKWDFILAINGADVTQASHEMVVEQIRRAGDLVQMTVVSLPDPTAEQAARRFATLPRKLSSGAAGRPPIPPLPPKRDPKTTLSVGRARARSLFNNFPELEALDRAIHDYDSEGRSTNSSSVDSETYRTPAAPKVASIRSRPTSARLSPRELEEMFARQGSAPRYPPTAGQGGPRVYASVAEMKRQKGKKPRGAGGTPTEPAGPDENPFGLRKDFLSTPDLQASLPNGDRRSHSQEDLRALMHGPGARIFASKYAWTSVERLCGRMAAGESGADTSEDAGIRSFLRRPRHLKSRDKTRGRVPVVGEGEYAVPPPQADGRRVPSTFRPSNDAKLYASPTEVRTLAFQSVSGEQSTLRRRLQARSRSVPPSNRTDSSVSGSEPATPTAAAVDLPSSPDETTPTNTPADVAQLYAQPMRRQQQQQLPPPVAAAAEEELPPPPAALLLQRPPPSPRASRPETAVVATPGTPDRSLKSLLEEKLAERQERLSRGETSPQRSQPQSVAQQGDATVTGPSPTLNTEQAKTTSKPAETSQDDCHVEQVTRITVGKKPLPGQSGIPSPRRKVSPPTPAPKPTMTKSHTVGSLSGEELRAARGRLRGGSRLPQPAGRREVEDGDNSSSGVSSDQDQAAGRYVTFIRTEGESEDSESSDDTSDRTWILRSKQPSAANASNGERKLSVGSLIERQMSSSVEESTSSSRQSTVKAETNRQSRISPPVETRRASSIPCLATARSSRPSPAPSSSSLSTSKATRPVSITVPGGRPARDSRQLRFGGTTTVVITGGGSSPEPTAEPEETEDDPIERSIRQIRSNARRLGGGAAAGSKDVNVPVVPPPPEFDAGLVLPPPPQFSDGAKNGATDATARPAAAAAQSRLQKPRTLALGTKPRPASLSPSSATAATPPQTVTSPRGSGIPRPGAAPATARKPGITSPSRIPGLVKSAPAHVKNRFRCRPVPQWTVEDTSDWLESLFLSEHKARFAEAAVDGQRLLALDGAALIELGVHRIGHRLNMDKSLKRQAAQPCSPVKHS